MRTLLIVCLLTGSASAQLEWRPSRMTGWEATMDPLRGRLVGCSLGRTFEWDGRFWSHHFPTVAPLVQGMLAWDPVQGRVLFLSKVAVAPSNTTQTWSWDGQAWIQHFPATNGPNLNGDSAMATDFARGRVVCFGGFSSIPTVTWEWDGTNWMQCFPANAPSSRSAFMMAWNAARNRVTLHGGNALASQSAHSDTWEWDGVNWLLRATNGPARRNAGMATAPDGHLVMFGGLSNSIGPALADTWTWNGTVWTQRFPVHSPGPHYSLKLALDPVRNVTLMMSTKVSIDGGQLWEWDGQDWVQRSQGYPIGARSQVVAADPDRARVVAYGRENTTSLTWEWDGNEWRRFPVSGPSYRTEAPMAFAGNGRTLLFGGQNPYSGLILGDTWTWNGASWTQQSPATSPPARRAHAMVFDAARGELVMFGGHGLSSPLNDTWTWNGSNWTQRNPATQPSARAGIAMADDPARGVVVMFGGTAVPETWEWNGIDWQLVPTGSGPPGLGSPMLATSPDGLGVVLYGGQTLAGPYYTQIQRWNGTSWTALVTAGPLPSVGPGTFDPVRRHVVGLGEEGVWLLDGTSHAEGIPFGIGCPGSAGRPELGIAGAWPFLGNTVTMEVKLVPAAALVLLVMGFSADQIGTAALPLELSNLGMPGCWLYSSMEASAWLVASSGVATSTLTVPNSVGLLGLELFAQAGAFDPPANAAGLTVSNGLKLRIGQ